MTASAGEASKRDQLVNKAAVLRLRQRHPCMVVAGIEIILKSTVERSSQNMHGHACFFRDVFTRCAVSSSLKKLNERMGQTRRHLAIHDSGAARDSGSEPVRGDAQRREIRARFGDSTLA
jgi:hypothetical protein